MLLYRFCRPPETALRERMHALAAKRRRFGYRRLFVLPRWEGEASGRTRNYRLCREEGLTVRKRQSRRRFIGNERPFWSKPGANAAGRWTLCMTSSPTVVSSQSSTWSTTSPESARRQSRTLRSSSRRIARELSALINRYGKPGAISDNGTEFTSAVILAWAEDHRVAWHYIVPGKPTQKGFVKRLATLAFGSTAGCTTSCQTRACSLASTTPARCWPGQRTTTPAGRTALVRLTVSKRKIWERRRNFGRHEH